MANLHVIIGEDDFLVNEAVKKLLDGVEGVEIIDSNLSHKEELELRDIALAEESFSTPPFLEPSKATWWKNVGFLPHAGGNSSSEEVKRQLERFAVKLVSSPLPANQMFILSAPKLLSTSIFAKTLKKGAEFKLFSVGKPWERAKTAIAAAEAFAKDEGFSFARGAAERFVSIVGLNTRTLSNEVKKLRAYLGASSTVAEVSDIVAITSSDGSSEPEIWSITDAIGERNSQKLWEALSKFEGESGFAVMVTTVVEKFFRTLLELKDAHAKGRDGEASASMSPFAAKKNLAFAANWTLMELRIARARLISLRERSVSSASGIDALVVTELLRICASKKGAV